MATLRYTDKVEAAVVVTARLGPDGVVTAKASASCAYAPKEMPGATASAEVDLDPIACEAIKAAMEKGLGRLEDKLGGKLRMASLMAYQTSVQLREIA